VARRLKRKRGHKTWAGFQRKDDWNKTREAFRLCSARTGAKAASTTTLQAPWLTDYRAVHEHAFSCNRCRICRRLLRAACVSLLGQKKAAADGLGVSSSSVRLASRSPRGPPWPRGPLRPSDPDFFPLSARLVESPVATSRNSARNRWLTALKTRGAAGSCGTGGPRRTGCSWPLSGDSGAGGHIRRSRPWAR